MQRLSLLLVTVGLVGASACNTSTVIGGADGPGHDGGASDAGDDAGIALPPTPLSLQPRTGPEAGGTAFALTGTDFVDGATLTFDGVAATAVLVESSTRMTGVTPAGVAGPADLVVTNPDTRSGTLAAGFTYLAPSTPKSALFFSDFSAATGTSAAAKDDGGKWDVIGSAGMVLANPGNLGLPANMQNVLVVSWSGGSGGWRIGPPFGPGIVDLAVGSTRFYRYYFRQVQPDGTTDTQTHPVQDGSGGSQTNWTLQCFNNVGNGVWKMGHGFWGNPFPYDQFHLLTPLTKGVTYRLEHSIERVTATTFRFDTRVFDESVSAVTPIYDGDDFRAGDSPTGSTMTEYFTSSTLTFNDAANLDGLNAGVNDNDPSEPGDYAYQGGFAVADDQGWIGPYGSVVGEAPP